MKKILALCCSDVLGIPALLQLRQQNALLAIATTDKVPQQFIAALLDQGFGKNDIHVLSKKDLERQFAGLIATYRPDAVFTFAFSWLIPDAVLNLLPNRFFNFHAGLLPKYKGADPIFWQLRNGDQTGGISVHLMTANLDSGPLVLVKEMPIMPGENYGLYAQRLGLLAADTAIILLDNLDDIKPLPATTANEPAMFLKPPSAADLTVNWQQQTAEEIACLVNAANPRYNGAITSLRQMQLLLMEVAPADLNNPANEQLPPGTVVHADLFYGLIVACINKEFLKINVVCMQQGYFSGSKLFSMGFRAGDIFQ